MKLLLRESKIIFFVAVILCLFTNCRDKDYSYTDFIEAKPTHSIRSKYLKGKIEEVLKNTKDFGEIDSEVILLFISKKEKIYEICISRTSYNTFKNYRPDMYNDLRGYSKFGNIPILLYGNIDTVFMIKNNVRFYNILGKSPEYDLDNPPIVYEPRMICSESVN